jgi:hypothetical protein
MREEKIASTFNQFHQHFTRTFCVDILTAKKLRSKTVIREKLHEKLLYEKGSSKMLMKLTPDKAKGL